MKSKDQKYQEAIQRAAYGMNRHLRIRMLARIYKSKNWHDAIQILRHVIRVRKNESNLLLNLYWIS